MFNVLQYTYIGFVILGHFRRWTSCPRKSSHQNNRCRRFAAFALRVSKL